MKWFMEKQERVKQLAVFVVVLCILGGLFLSITGEISKSLRRIELPQGEVQELVRSMPDMGVSYPEICIQCPTYPYQVRVPEGTEQKGGMLFGKINGISYIIAETAGTLKEMMQDTLPRTLNQPVLGYAPRYEESVGKDGYLYDKKASYQAGPVQTKISVRSVMEYTCAYMLYLDHDRKLIVYASTQDKKLWREAEAMIRQIAISTEVYGGALETQKSDDCMGEKEQSAWMDFAIEIKNDFYLDNGVCVFHWTNVSVIPQEVVLLEDGKEISYMEEDYSIPGEYIFMIGESTPKTYQICGISDAPLYNVWVNFQELEDYIGYIESQEDPEFWIPRQPDEISGR